MSVRSVVALANGNKRRLFSGSLRWKETKDQFSSKFEETPRKGYANSRETAE